MQSQLSQGDLVLFLNSDESYPPHEDVEVRVKRRADGTASSRDWIGLFRCGWISVTRDYVTFEWVPGPTDWENGCCKVVFSGRRLPRDDGQNYQFCYVSREGALQGSSRPFRFTITTLDSNRREATTEKDFVNARSPERMVEVLSCDDATPVESESFCGVDNDNSLVVVESLKKELAHSVERIRAAEAANRELREQGDDAKIALITKDKEMQMTREQMENLIKCFSAKIDLLEERISEKQKTCEAEMELHSKQLAIQNAELNEKLSQCIAEVDVLKRKLEHKEYLNLKMEQPLMGAINHSVQTVTCITSSTPNDACTSDGGVVLSLNADVTGSLHTDGSTSDVERSDLEALQIAYGTIEKYYHAACDERDQCQIKLLETENRVKSLEQELEERISKEPKPSAQTTTIQNSSDTPLVKELEHRIQESETRYAMAIAQAADHEEQYKFRIEELEHQLLKHNESAKVHAELLNNFDAPLRYDEALHMLRKFIGRLRCIEDDSNMVHLLSELEKVNLKLNTSGVADCRVTNKPHSPANPDNSAGGVRQCPVCLLEFPQSMPEKNFKRHVRRHETSDNI